MNSLQAHPDARRRRPKGWRGFTLIELILSLGLSGMIVSLAVGTYAQSVKFGRIASQRSEMIREGAFAITVLQNSLRQAGLGMPTVGDIGTGLLLHNAPLILGNGTQIGIVADLARPHAQYNTFGTISGKAGGDRKKLAWHTENNGTCMPMSNLPPDCTVATASLFFPGQSGCDSAPGGFVDRVCPWGMKRLEDGDRFQIVSGAGDWTTADATGLALALNGTIFVADWTTDYTDPTASWANAADGDPPTAVTGVGYVTTLDRVFFKRQGAAAPYTLVRKQCWGDPDPTDAEWPNGAVTTVAAGFDPGADVTNNACEPAGAVWEVILRDVQSLSFTYVQADGTTIVPNSAANKALVRRVDYTIQLSRVAYGQTIKHDLVGSAAFRNPL